MPSYVRAGIRKCARIRALSSTAVRSMLHTMNVVIRKEAAMKYGMRKPNWNIYDAETNDMVTKIHNNQCMVN